MKQITMRLIVNGEGRDVQGLGEWTENGFRLEIPPVSGYADARTQFVAEGQAVTMIKSGEMQMSVSFEEGKRTETEAKTVYGAIPMTVTTQKVQVLKRTGDALLRLVYFVGEEEDARRFSVQLIARIGQGELC